MTMRMLRFSCSSRSPEKFLDLVGIQENEVVEKSVSGGDMRKLLAVGVVALGTFGLLAIRAT